MDRVTQQNAANAEGSASASQQIRSQAASIENIINDLKILIGAGTVSAKDVEPVNAQWGTEDID